MPFTIWRGLLLHAPEASPGFRYIHHGKRAAAERYTNRNVWRTLGVQGGLEGLQAKLVLVNVGDTEGETHGR